MRILAIDPGPYESAWCFLWKLQHESKVQTAKVKNEELLELIRKRDFDAEWCAVEMIGNSYGRAVGLETMETVVWIGRFQEAWENSMSLPCLRILRKTIVTHLTENPKATDALVRQAVLDRFGGNSVALGTKANRGPLFGVTKDGWQALALALYMQDQAQNWVVR